MPKRDLIDGLTAQEWVDRNESAAFFRPLFSALGGIEETNRLYFGHFRRHGEPDNRRLFRALSNGERRMHLATIVKLASFLHSKFSWCSLPLLLYQTDHWGAFVISLAAAQPKYDWLLRLIENIPEAASSSGFDAFPLRRNVGQIRQGSPFAALLTDVRVNLPLLVSEHESLLQRRPSVGFGSGLETFRQRQVARAECMVAKTVHTAMLKEVGAWIRAGYPQPRGHSQLRAAFTVASNRKLEKSDRWISVKDLLTKWIALARMRSIPEMGEPF